MNIKELLTLVILALSINIFAQAPTNGLVAYYPFNGNAIDESGNGNNGLVYGATLTKDRFGNSNSAFSFSSSYIESIVSNIPLNNSSRTIAGWFKTDTPNFTDFESCIFNYGNLDTLKRFALSIYPKGYLQPIVGADFSNGYDFYVNNYNYLNNNWYFFTLMYDGTNISLFVNGTDISSFAIPGRKELSLKTTNNIFRLGRRISGDSKNDFFDGIIDDIRIYNRVLTQQEINNLYAECNLSVSITPFNNILKTTSTAYFIANSNGTNNTYQWQTNANNLGWQDLPNNTKYSGSSSNLLEITNIKLSNHFQTFRVIAKNEICVDTSSIATLTISDTCINTRNIVIYDTIHISVADTLYINATLTNIIAPNNTNTIKIYPNPTYDHIIIDYGDFNKMNGCSMKIVNSLGEIVFTTIINQQSTFVDINNWTGQGLYYVNLVDSKNNVITKKIIVLK